jgi:hypothetical protein
MRRTASWLLAVIALSTLSSCHLGVDEEQPWNLRERRQVFKGARGLPRGALEQGQFEIVTPLGVEARQLALAARDALTVQRGALVQGISSSMGAVNIETGARVGHLYALGDSAPVLEERAFLQGYLRSRPEHGATPVKPKLGVVQNAPVAAERFEWRMAFPAVEPADCVPEPSTQALALEPDAYGELVIGAGVTVALRSGHYHFAALSLRDGGRLELDNLAGPVYLWVERALEMEGQVSPDFPDGNTLFGYAGSAPVSVKGLAGTLVAPAAEVRVRAGEPSVGALFAAQIVLEAKAVVVHRSFEVAPPDTDIMAVCQRCAHEQEARPSGTLFQVRPDCIDCPALEKHAPRVYRDSCATAKGD